MGCWNGTCGISQLPILAGTKVKAYLMLQSEFAQGIGGSGTCYTTGYFRPWFFPVSAEYNDYGSIERIQEDWNSKYMLATFQKWLAAGEVKILGDEAEINDPGVKAFKTLDQVFDCVERGALVFKNHGETFDKAQEKWVPTGGYLKIGMFMVLDNVHHDLIAEADRFLKSPENDYYMKRDTEDRKKALDTIKKIRETRANPPVATEKTGLELSDEVLEAMASMRDIWVDRFLGDLIEEHCAFKHYKTVLYDPAAVSVEDFFSMLNDVRSICTAMSYLRKMWFPQTGQGSQSEELSFNKALVNAMSEHIGHRNAEMAQQEIEDEKWQKEYEAKQAKEKAKKKKAKK